MVHIISPHIDDAIFSLGGLIHRLTDRHKEIFITYVFTISEWVNEEAPGAADVKDRSLISLLRAQEEENVSALFRYRFEFLNYREHPIRNADSDQNMVSFLRSDFNKKVASGNVCFFPLGIDHPDHIILGNLGAELFSKGHRIFFYEDLPYAAKRSEENLKLFASLENRKLKPESIPFDIDKKIDAMKLYRSQLSPHWEKIITNYAYDPKSKTFSERFWKPSNESIIRLDN